jgi:hypothetical protein
LRKTFADDGQRARRGCARGSESARSSSTGEAFARQLDRRRHQLRQRELARAVFLVRKGKARDRAGHADAERAVARLARISLAALV